MPARDAADTGSEDFGHVGAIAQRKGQDAGRHCTDHVPKLGDAQVDEVDLDQQRYAAKERGVEACDGDGEAVGGQPRRGTEQRQDEGDGDRQGRNVDGGEHPLGDHETDLAGDEAVRQIEGVEEQQEQDQQFAPHRDHLGPQREAAKDEQVQDQGDGQGAGNGKVAQ
ncbi:hypothetical protein D3C81_734030 [compost metagenome]